MPSISFYRTVPTAAGIDAPATGHIRFRPTKARTLPGSPDNVVLPVPFTVALLAGAADVTLEPTAPGWAWRVDESVDGIRDETYYALVPDVPGPLDDADLARVDYATLTPTAAPVAAWWAVANSTITAAAVVGDDLVLTRHDGSTVNAGTVRTTTGELAASVDAAVADALPGAADAAVQAALPATVDAAVDSAVPPAVDTAVDAAVPPAVDASVQAALPAATAAAVAAAIPSGALWFHTDTDGRPYFA